MTPNEAIARCTRNGHTSWQNVSKILGEPMASVKAKYGSTAIRKVQEPREEPQAPILSNSKAKRFSDVLKALERPQSSVTAMSRALKIERKTLTDILHAMEQAGMAEKTVEGPKHVWRKKV